MRSNPFSFSEVIYTKTKKLESRFQKEVIKDIKTRMPDAIVMKNDPHYIQGIPDLVILNGEHWGALEVKRSVNAVHQPNQDYYVDKMNRMSFAAFIFPENKDFILDRLEDKLSKEDDNDVRMGRRLQTQEAG